MVGQAGAGPGGAGPVGAGPGRAGRSRTGPAQLMHDRKRSVSFLFKVCFFLFNKEKMGPGCTGQLMHDRIRSVFSFTSVFPFNQKEKVSCGWL